MPAPGLVIFDCDGVLVDSEPISMRELARAINALGVEMTAAVTAWFRSRSSMLRPFAIGIDSVRKYSGPMNR